MDHGPLPRINIASYDLMMFTLCFRSNQHDLMDRSRRHGNRVFITGRAPLEAHRWPQSVHLQAAVMVTAPRADQRVDAFHLKDVVPTFG